MSVRVQATALFVALMAAACGPAGEATTAAGASMEGATPTGQVTRPSDGAGNFSASKGHHGSGSLVDWGDSLEEVAAQLELTVLVRATNKAWTEPAPGQPAKEERPDDEKFLADLMVYHWRQFEVIDVLSGAYEYETLNYGNRFERTRAGETYLLIISVLPDQDWEPLYSDQHFTGPLPPYLLTVDDILTSTEPTLYPELDTALTLAEARARLGDTDSQDEQSELSEVPTPVPSLDEQSG